MIVYVILLVLLGVADTFELYEVHKGLKTVQSVTQQQRCGRQ
jgi:hypothetical protein